MPFFTAGSAFTGGPKQLAADPAIAGVATKHRVSPSQVALAWLLQHSERILLIPGTRSVKHLEENIAAASLQLPQAAFDRLSALKFPPASLRG